MRLELDRVLRPGVCNSVYPLHTENEFTRFVYRPKVILRDLRLVMEIRLREDGGRRPEFLEEK